MFRAIADEFPQLSFVSEPGSTPRAHFRNVPIAIDVVARPGVLSSGLDSANREIPIEWTLLGCSRGVAQFNAVDPAAADCAIVRTPVGPDSGSNALHGVPSSAEVDIALII